MTLFNSVVSSVSVADVMSTMPFLNKVTWRAAQHDCCDLCRAFVHLKHGNRPSHKARNLKHLRRYLRVATLDQHGLIIVNKDDPFASKNSLIVVPHKLLPTSNCLIGIYLA